MNSFIETSIPSPHYFDQPLIKQNPQQIPNLSFNIQGKLIKLLDGVYLIIKNVCYKNGVLKITSRFIHQNGSYIYIPLQYQNLFSLFNNTFSQNIAYIFQTCNHFFLLDIQLNFLSFNSNCNLYQLYTQYLFSNLSSFTNIFSILHLIKNHNQISLYLKKCQLKLKKSIANSLSLSKSTSIPSNTTIDHSQRHNCVIQVNQITELSLLQHQHQQNQIIKKGGYFQVISKKCQITSTNNSKIIKKLAIKKSKKNFNKPKKIIQKVIKQINVASQINNNKYALNYYLPKNNTNAIYMDHVSHNLKEILQTSTLSIGDIFSISKQLVEGVMILHESQIVHRDLKLQNILIEKKQKTKNIKIIDFCESAMFKQQYIPQHNLGCTVPYSPIECMMQVQQGFNKQQIDYWSVMVIIYEMSFNKLPFYFNRQVLSDLVQGWSKQGQFYLNLNIRPRNGFRKIEQIMSEITQYGLKINQKQRINLYKIKSILQYLQIFYLQLLELTHNIF